MDDALDGDKAARELVVDRVEGKPMRAEKVVQADNTLEETIDRAAVAQLNGLLPTGGDDHAV